MMHRQAAIFLDEFETTTYRYEDDDRQQSTEGKNYNTSCVVYYYFPSSHTHSFFLVSIERFCKHTDTTTTRKI